VRFVVEKVVLGQSFLQVLWIYVISVISIDAPFSSSFTCYFSRKEKREKSGNPPKSNSVLEIGENWIEEYFRCFGM
jgi:hypothetical protein